MKLFGHAGSGLRSRMWIVATDASVRHGRGGGWTCPVDGHIQLPFVLEGAAKSEQTEAQDISVNEFLVFGSGTSGDTT